MYKEEFDDLEKFERQDTKHKLPPGWLALYIGLIIFGIIYFYLYTPIFTGWSQSKVFEESLEKK